MGVRISIYTEFKYQYTIWWENYRKWLFKNRNVRHHGIQAGLLTVDEINWSLIPWNCKYLKPDHIEFDTEKDLTLFLLRWS